MTPLDSVPLFDELAGGFDQLVPMFSTFANQLADVMALPPGARLLDLGCGRGAVTRAALARGWDVVAVDAAPNMVAELRRDQPEVDALVMDAHSLELADATFDAVAASFVIHILDEPERVVAEAVRVLRPGGLVAMTVPAPLSDDRRWDRYFALSGSSRPTRRRRPSSSRPTWWPRTSPPPASASTARSTWRSTSLSPRPTWPGGMRCPTASPATSVRCGRKTNRSFSAAPWPNCSGCTTREGSASSAERRRTWGSPAPLIARPDSRRTAGAHLLAG